MQIFRNVILAGLAGVLVYGQQPAAPLASTGAVFKSESRLVVVDAVVTDKKGNYTDGGPAAAAEWARAAEKAEARVEVPDACRRRAR